ELPRLQNGRLKREVMNFSDFEIDVWNENELPRFRSRCLEQE
ncbi:772_t:CDS:2, partial [Rhizophagus irregularis]